MRLLTTKITNFGSYKELNFDYKDQGLTLINGPTGAGKSTLCDAAAWILYSFTAKGVSVDQVRSWNSSDATIGTIDVDLGGKILTVTRIRGKTNDLHYNLDKGPPIRGRDLPDTQKLINTILGMDISLFLCASYYHEFSQTAQFFMTTAKNRRAICEQLVDLTLAVKLQHRLLDEYKTINKQLSIEQTQETFDKTTLIALDRRAAVSRQRRKNWDEEHLQAHKQTLIKLEKFEASRERLISNKCNSCGTMLAEPHIHRDDSPNPWLTRLEAIEDEVNPHALDCKDYSEEIEGVNLRLMAIGDVIADYKSELLDIELLQQVASDYRSISIANTIAEIETNTNKLLSDYFDAEIRVQFDIADADKIDVQVYKDGNNATFQQLSKGQRGMLKLCFGISVMQAVQNHHGIDFTQVFFDEALDGLSDTLKLKAVRMLETARPSVYLVEHSEALKAMITNQYIVTLTSEGSQIEKA